MSVTIERFNPFAETHSLSDVPKDLADGQPLPIGFHFLVNEYTAEVYPEALRFLSKHVSMPLYQATGSYPANTVRTYAEDLRPWATFLDARGVGWAHAAQRHLLEFVRLLLSYRMADGEALAPSVRKQRIATVLRCYEATDPKGVDRFDGAQALSEASRHAAFLVGPTGPRAARAQHNRFLTDEQWHKISVVLGDPPTDADLDLWRDATLRRAWGLQGLPVSTRGRLVAETALTTGMRVDEIAHLRVDQLPAVPPPADVPWVAVHITKTKRLRPRNVYVPRAVLIALLRYVDGERAHAVARRAATTGAKDQGRVFVGGADAGRAVGAAVTAGCLAAGFSRAVRRAGLILATEVEVDGTAMEVVRPRFSIHDLRDTFAMLLLSRLSPHMDARTAYLRVSARLGHATVSTTLRHYLHIADALEDGVASLIHSVVAEAIGGE